MRKNYKLPFQNRGSIDFSDEDGVPETINITNELKKISKDIMRVLEKGENYELITTGTKVTLTGPPTQENLAYLII